MDEQYLAEMQKIHDHMLGANIDALHDDRDALMAIGYLIEAANAIGSRQGMMRAISLCKRLVRRDLSSSIEAELYYFRGNAHADLRCLNTIADPNNRWKWEDEHLEQEILNYRRSIRCIGFADTPVDHQCQVYTNLGNSLSYIGRCVESIDFRQRALTLQPEFAMARGNLGYGLSYYARSLFDPGHRILFVQRARHHLRSALSGELDRGARHGFQAEIDRIEQWMPAEKIDDAVIVEPGGFGASDEECKYRLWAIKERLFLCPLADIDLEDMSIAARDTLVLPSIVVPLGEGPTHLGYFNQLKQEYVSARFLLYEAMCSSGPHFSDRDVNLYDTLDYPVYGLAVEKLKLVFRSTYSLFDKIAFFLNDYLSLQVPSNRVGFRTLWYMDQKRKRGLRQDLTNRENWPLRGLFWLSKDLASDAPGFRNAIEPDAQDWVSLRNHLEHKYLKVHGICLPDDPGLGLGDRLAHSIMQDDLESKTVQIMRTVRAALIYLSLAVFSEEEDRKSKRPTNAIIPGSTLPHIDDDEKVLW